MDHIPILAFLLITTSALLCVRALPPRNEMLLDEGPYYGLREALGDKESRNLDGLGGGNLLRDLEGALRRRVLYNRQLRALDSLYGNTLGESKRIDTLLGQGIGADKRNMDEIDRAGFNSFIKKKNFDEIDRTGFDGFVKRNFDEIDRVGFGSFVKRESPSSSAEHRNQNN